MHYIDISRKSRNLKSLIKMLKYVHIGKTYVFVIKNHIEHYIATYCKPRIEYVRRKRYDRLSGLNIVVKEAVLYVCSEELFTVKWDGEYYRVGITPNNHIVEIYCEAPECIRGFGEKGGGN